MTKRTIKTIPNAINERQRAAVQFDADWQEYSVTMSYMDVNGKWVKMSDRLTYHADSKNDAMRHACSIMNQPVPALA